MAESFVYVTYIRTTPEKLWHALTTPEFTRQYWFGVSAQSSWQPGAEWKLVFADGSVADTGEVLECDPPGRLVLKWRNEFLPEIKAEGFSRCVFEIEQGEGAVKLTITHTSERTGSKLVEAVSRGWPAVLSSLKSLLETGKALEKIKVAPKEN